MTTTCFLAVMTTAAICYAVGSAVGWHIRKSVVPDRKKTTVKREQKGKASAMKKAGLR